MKHVATHRPNGRVHQANGHAGPATLHGFTMSYGNGEAANRVVDAAIEWICAELLEKRPPQMGFALDSQADGGCIRVGGICGEGFAAAGGRKATSKRLRELAEQEGAQALVVWAWKRLKGEEKRARLVMEVCRAGAVTTLMVPAEKLAARGALGERELQRFTVPPANLPSPVILGNVMAARH